MKRTHQKVTVIATTALLVVGGLALMCYPKLTDARYSYEQWRLGTATAAAAERSDTGAVVLGEGTVALLEIPAIGLSAYVVEGTGDGSLAKGPGHYPATPLPGEDGNVGIAGHRTMHGHVFNELDKLSPGDEIHTATETRGATYTVTEVKVVDPNETDVVAPTDDNRLTLTTCHPIGSAAQRLVVVAVRTD